MATKKLSSNEAYDNCYHFIASTKYRKNVFIEEEKRARLKGLIESIVNGLEWTTCLAVTVAYNHIHVLVKTELNSSYISQCMYGGVSRIMREEYPELKSLNKNSLWGGKSCLPISDVEHFDACLSYIKRHQPDNTKVD